MAVEIGEELLIGEENNEQLYEVLYTCEINQKQYLVAGLSADLDNEEKEPEVTAFSYTEDEEGTIFFDDIESDDEFEQVESQFKAYIDQFENES